MFYQVQECNFVPLPPHSTNVFVNIKCHAREFGLPGTDANIFEKIDDTEELSTECYYICMQREIENLHWYNKTLLQEYWIQGLHLEDLHQKYKISKAHLTKDLNAAILQTIRENCEECD